MKPNVLIIVTDDQRQGLEVMPVVRHSIQDEGRRYPNAHVTTPACCPSRASIMTGRYAHNHGVRTNLDQRKLDHRDTLQFYLQRDGYRTGYVGKFLNNWPLTQGPPFFNDWSLSSPSAIDRRSRYYGGRINVDGAIRRVDQYSTDFFGGQATKLLDRYERQDARPWLMFVAPSAPHPPFIPAVQYRDAQVPPFNGNPGIREKDLSDKPQWVRQAEDGGSKTPQEIRALQYRLLMSVDDMASRILRGLNKLGEAKDTLVIFISDNGYAWGEHGLTGKFVPYTEAHKVPLLIRWPNHFGPASTDDRLIGNIDIAPTILDAAGIVPDGPAMDGKSLLDETWTRPRLLLEYSKHNYSDAPNWASTFTETTQYVEYYSGGEIMAREYYDLDQDPFQLLNLLGDDNALNDPPTVPALSLQLEQDRSCSGATCP